MLLPLSSSVFQEFLDRVLHARLQGFDQSLMDVLVQFYPKALMSELSLYAHRSLMDLHNAFPNSVIIGVDNLFNLGQVGRRASKDLHYSNLGHLDDSRP